MRRFYRILLFMSVVIAHTWAYADKTINLTTNLPAATSITVVEGYDALRYEWKDDGTLSMTLSDKTGFNLNVNNGYSVSSISVDGKQLTSTVGSTYYVEPKNLTDGCTVDIQAAARQSMSVTIAGDPSRLLVSYQYHLYEKSEWSNGRLKIDLTDNTSTVQISPRSGYGLSSVEYDGNNELEQGAAVFYIYPNTLKAGDNLFNVECYSLAEVRTSTFRVEVDGDPADVVVSRAGDATEFTGSALSSPIPFSPEIDLPVVIRNRSYGRTFYQVIAGDDEIPCSDGEYRVRSLADGEVIRVNVNYPDIDIPVRFTFTNPDTDGAIASVLDTNFTVIDSEKWLAPDFTVKMGSILRVNLDDANFVVSASLNGVEAESSNITFTALDEAGYDINVTAEPREPFVVTFYYESLPSHFRVLRGNADDDFVEMTGRDMTKVQVARNLNRVRIVPDEGWVVTYVYVNGAESSADFRVTGNMTVDVYVEEYPRDNELALYFEPDAAWDYRTLTLNSQDSKYRRLIYLEDGYTPVKFSSEDLPLKFEVLRNGAHDYVTYVDNALVADNAEELRYPADGSVIKFFTSQQQFCKVDFSVAEDADATIIRDLIVELENPLTESILPGTQFCVTPAEGTAVKVISDGVELPNESDGKCIFSVASDMKVEIMKGTLSGIDAIGADENSDVFTLQGIRIARNADAATLRRLPAGIYIVAGKKIKVN